jgi:glucose/arabinose dehydrogenase
VRRHRVLALALALLAAAIPAALSAADPAPSTGPFVVAGAVDGVGLQQVANGLDAITAITHDGTGDGRLFITMQDGRVLILMGGAARAQPFLDLRGQISSGGERGLLSTAFHPRYGENGLFFVDYTNPQGDTVIARYHVSSDPNRADPASARTLLTIAQPFANHNGGQLQFGPDGYLYVGMGDGGSANDPACRAQKGDTLLGKLLRLDVDQNADTPPYYGIPPDNPFRGPGDPLDEIWADGLRNPWRFSFDRSNGELWIADVGQGAREEVDFQPPTSNGGENYGWKVMEGASCAGSEACPAGTPPCHAAAFIDPVLEYNHNPHCSITGGYVYRGAQVPQLLGAYVFGDLCSGAMWAAFRQGNGSSLVVRSLPFTAPQLTTFGEDDAGELYAATLGGQVYRFVRTNAPPPAAADRVGLYEPQPSRFELKQANTRAAKVTLVRFGARHSGALPLGGDWDGDGVSTVGLYDADTGTLQLKNSHNGRNADVVVQLAPPVPGARPIAGDWDGDGRDGVGLFDASDPSNPRFLLWNVPVAGTPADEVLSLALGGPWTDVLPVAGDWDGDGRDEVGVYSPSRAVFVLGGRGPVFDVVLGTPGRGALPVAGDWDGEGRDGVGVYDPRQATFSLRNALTSGAPDVVFRFGPPRGGWLPLAGAW